jgi:hypothetical protein
MEDIKLIDTTLKVLKRAKKFCLDAEAKVYKRCLLEGCRYGIEGVDKEPKDECIYCGELRRDNFIGVELAGFIKKIQDDKS